MIIYTHTGKAHADELYAIAILKATHEGPFEVKRVVQVPEMGPDDFAVDVGREYDGRRKFDHHQFDVNMVKHSAATLVADAFAKPLLINRDWGDLLNRVAAMDTCVPSALDIPMDTARQYLKLEWALVAQFEKDPDGTTDLLGLVIRNELAEIAQFHHDVLRAKAWLEKYSDIRGIKTIRALEITRDPAEDGLSDRAVQAAQTLILKSTGVSVIYSWDPRDPERKLRRLYRTDYGSGKVDFRRAQWGNQVFCHNTGFMLTFSPEHSREWVDIVTASVL